MKLLKIKILKKLNLSYKYIKLNNCHKISNVRTLSKTKGAICLKFNFYVGWKYGQNGWCGVLEKMHLIIFHSPWLYIMKLNIISSLM